MELRAGYKQTEVGVIPEDWEVRPARDVCRINQGLQIPIANRLKDPSSRAKKYLTIQYLNEGKGAEYIEDYTASVCCAASDVLMTRTGNTGTVITNVEGVFHNNFFKIKYDRQLLQRDFLVDYLRLDRLQRLILTKAGTSTIPDLNHNDFYSIPVIIPPKAEQEAIAGALSDADGLIESLEQLIAKKRHLKQGAMQQLLTGKKRLPGFSGEWEEYSLGQMGECHRGVGYNPNTDLYASDTSSTVRLLRSNNIQDERIVFEDMQFVDSSRVADIQRLRCDDVVLCMANGSRRLVGKAGRFSNSDGFEYTFGAFMGCFRPDIESTVPKFLFYLFQTEAYRAHIGILLAGSSINNLRPSDVESLAIPVPVDRAEQTAIAAVLSDMDGEIEALETKLGKARQLKAGMMHNLLTGRIRLA